MRTLSARLISAAGKVPVLSILLRRVAGHYTEGSVVRIRCGHAAGLLWRRHHRYVNGYWVGTYELPLQRELTRELTPGNVFFDVGANAGFFTLIAARSVGPSGKCVAFEPWPENAQSVREQVELNRFRCCQVVMEAVSNQSGSACLQSRHTGPSTVRLGPSGDAASVVRVRTTTLDDAFRKWGRPDLIKMDIEGAEALALEGAQGLLAACHPTWIIELHGPAEEHQVRNLLAKYAYRFSAIDQNRPQAGDMFPKHLKAK